MNTERKTFNVVVPDATHTEAAKRVSQWVSADGHMLPKTPDQVGALFDEGRAVLLYDGRQLVGHAAATFVNPDQSIEVGALFTEETHRGQGVATQATVAIVGRMRETSPGAVVYALANERSAPLFQKLGARPMQTHELCSAVWEACETCPRRPEQNGDVFVCCDTPYDLTHVGKEKNENT